MTAASSFILPFALTYCAVLIVPGPNLAVVAEAFLWRTTRAAVTTVVGIAAGGGMLAGAMALGAVSLGEFGPLRTLAHAAIVVVLATIGCRALARVFDRGRAGGPLPSRRRRGDFLWGFFTASTNPISAAFFLGSALSFGEAPTVAQAAVMGAAVFMLALCWFGLVGTLLASPMSRRAYRAHWRPVDACAGLILLAAAATAGLHLVAA